MSNLLQKFNACLRAKYTHVENDASYAIERDGSKLTLYFQKSNGRQDWWNNFYFPAKPYRDMKNLWFCHRGFLKVWKSIEPYIAADIADPSVTTIEIIGYSHGGAIGHLCFEYIKFNRPDIEVTGYGFGSPRVMWGFAKKSVKERFKGYTVIRNGNDLITHLPPIFFGFRHICEVIKVKDSEGRYEKVKAEVKLRKRWWGKIGGFISAIFLYVIFPIYDHFPSKYRNALKEFENNYERNELPHMR